MNDPLQPTTDTPSIPDITFASMALAEPVQRALTEQNYTIPTPIQAQAIPLILEGRDLLGCAQTGTGKTAAFSLPLLHRLALHTQKPAPKTVRALVLVPTRELAIQVSKSVETYGKHLRVSKALVYGGVGYTPQIKAMSRGVDVLVATPGRLMDLMESGHVDLRKVEFFVLDEADRMLDMGFIHDMRKISAEMPETRQTLFFSATMAPAVRELANSLLRQPAQVSITPQKTTGDRIQQHVCFMKRDDKLTFLNEMLEAQKNEAGSPLTLIFGRTKHGSEKLSIKLAQAGHRVEVIHGGKSQAARERALQAFRAKKVRVLVATDVAARGIDVKDITLVVNFDLPDDPESYVHRIGRTARAGAEGMALTLCSHEELGELKEVEKWIGKSIPVMVEHPYHSDDLAAAYLERSKDPRSRAPQRRRRQGGSGGGGAERRRSSSSAPRERGESRPERRRFEGNDSRSSGGERSSSERRESRPPSSGRRFSRDTESGSRERSSSTSRSDRPARTEGGRSEFRPARRAEGGRSESRPPRQSERSSSEFRPARPSEGGRSEFRPSRPPSRSGDGDKRTSDRPRFIEGRRDFKRDASGSERPRSARSSAGSGEREGGRSARPERHSPRSGSGRRPDRGEGGRTDRPRRGR
ncbi:MAG: DEAD/DEAH box helicase [Candidatus Methylacidiphilales bacterium]